MNECSSAFSDVQMRADKGVLCCLRCEGLRFVRVRAVTTLRSGGLMTQMKNCPCDNVKACSENSMMWKWGDLEICKLEELQASGALEMCTHTDLEIWRTVSLQMWKYGDLEISRHLWRSEHLSMWGSGDLAIWRSDCCGVLEVWGPEDLEMWKWEDLRIRRPGESEI